MSTLSLADSSYMQVISQWIDAHQWVGSGQQQSILVVQADDTTQPEQYQVQSGFGDFEFSASYTPGVDQLNDVTVSFDVPLFGTVLLVEESTYPLSADPGQTLSVSVADGLITGEVSFKYVGEGSDTEVFSDYTLNVPFSDTLEDSISIFPTDLQHAKTIDSPQSSNARRSGGKALRHLESRSNDQDQSADFLNDHALDGNKILIGAYNSPQDTSDTAASLNLKEYESSVSFLGIFEMVSSIDPELTMSGVLYAKIPIIGRVKLVNLNGSLVSGITQDINVIVAKGTVALTAEQNSSGKYVLYTNVNLDIKFIGKISSNGKIKLLTLPF